MTTATAIQERATALAELSLADIEELDPGICDRLEELRGGPISCGRHPRRSLAEVAEAENLPLRALVKSVEHAHPRSDNTAPKRLRHRPVEIGHRESPEQRLAQSVGIFSVLNELTQLQQEHAWIDGDRNSKTLVKRPDLRIVLMSLKRGARLDAHWAPGSIAIHLLAGHMRVTAAAERVELTPGEIMSLDGGLEHDVEATEDSALLLTIGW